MDEPDEPPTAPLGGLLTDFAELRQAWINEKAAPEILQYVCHARRSRHLLLRSASDGLARRRVDSSWTWLSGCQCRRKIRRASRGRQPLSRLKPALARSPPAPARRAPPHSRRPTGKAAARASTRHRGRLDSKPVLVCARAAAPRRSAPHAAPPAPRMDLNRVKYLLRAYLRVRLAKARRLHAPRSRLRLTAGYAD